MSAPGAHLAPRVATGVCGSGKTYRLMALAREAVERGYVVVVVDVNGEWRLDRSPLYGLAAPWARVLRPDRVAAAHARGARLILGLVEPDETETPTRADVEAYAEALLALGGDRWLVVPEVHQAVKNPGAMPPRLRALVHRYRHLGAGVMLDTQHFRDLHTEFRDAAAWHYVHATGSARDWRALEEWGSRELVDLVRECSRRMQRGQPGWHVPVHHAATAGPYRLAR